MSSEMSSEMSSDIWGELWGEMWSEILAPDPKDRTLPPSSAQVVVEVVVHASALRVGTCALGRPRGAGGRVRNAARARANPTPLPPAVR